MERVLPVILLVALAGCTSDAPRALEEDAAVVPPEPISPRLPETTIIEVAIDAGVGAPQLGPYAQFPGPTNGGPTEVERGARALLVEGKWSCMVGPCTVTLEVEDPKDVDHYRMTTDTDVRWAHVPDSNVTAGKWDLAIFPDPALIGLKGELRVTVFYATWDESFSAFA